MERGLRRRTATTAAAAPRIELPHGASKVSSSPRECSQGATSPPLVGHRDHREHAFTLFVAVLMTGLVATNLVLPRSAPAAGSRGEFTPLLQLAYAVTASVAGTLALSCATKAHCTKSARKRDLMVHLLRDNGAVALILSLCACDVVYVPLGARGHRVNVAVSAAWMLTAWTTASLHTTLSYYSAMKQARAPRRVALMVVEFSLEILAAAARLLPTRCLLVGVATVAVPLCAESIRLRREIMRSYVPPSVTEDVDRPVTLLASVAAAATMCAANAASLLYAADLTSSAVTEVALCVAIVVRLLRVYCRSVVAMLRNDEELLEVQRVARQLEAARQEMYRFVFHELRVPLNSVILGLEQLEAERSTPAEHAAATATVPAGGQGASPTADTLDMMKQAGNSMLQLLSDLLDVARMEANAFAIVSKPLSLHSMVRAVGRSLHVCATSAQVQTTARIGSGVPDWVYGDERRLLQVMANFVSNALKFSPRDGSGCITIEARLQSPDELPEAASALDRARAEWRPEQHGDGILEASPRQSCLAVPTGIANSDSDAAIDWQLVRLSCTDTGCGISEADLPRVFIPFQQLDSSARFAGRGTGLGLSIVRAVVAAHGGVVGVRSLLGYGSEFFAVMPFRVVPEVVALRLRQPTPSRADAAATASFANATRDPAPRVAVLPAAASDKAVDRHATVLPPHVATLPPHHPPLQEGPPPSLTTASAGNAAHSLHNEASGASAGATSGWPLRILVVDDVEGNRRLLARGVGRRFPHAAVDQAETGIQAVVVATRAAYDVILMDNMMPLMTGAEATRQLRASGCTSLIVGCTGNTLGVDMQHFLHAGADVVLSKPIDMVALVAAITTRQHELAAGDIASRPADGEKQSAAP
jgi:signal transduction histidine kinase/ActR/RegA family two-component response regulator